MIFNIGKYELVVIAAVALFFFGGVPVMAYMLSRAGARTRQRLVRVLAGVRSFWRAWRA